MPIDNFTNPLSFIKFENSPFLVRWNANKTALKFSKRSMSSHNSNYKSVTALSAGENFGADMILLVVSMAIRIKPTAIQPYRSCRIMVSFPSWTLCRTTAAYISTRCGLEEPSVQCKLHARTPADVWLRGGLPGCNRTSSDLWRSVPSLLFEYNANLSVSLFHQGRTKQIDANQPIICITVTDLWALILTRWA